MTKYFLLFELVSYIFLLYYGTSRKNYDMEQLRFFKNKIGKIKDLFKIMFKYDLKNQVFKFFLRSTITIIIYYIICII